MGGEEFGCRVDSVPGCDVVVAFGRYHNGGHDGGNVEVGPGKHLLEHGVDGEVVAVSFDSVFHRDAALVVDGFVGIAVVVGLNQEPGCFVELIDSVGSFWVAFDDHSLS